jgi:hypothetical protein
MPEYNPSSAPLSSVINAQKAAGEFFSRAAAFSEA